MHTDCEIALVGMFSSTTSDGKCLFLQLFVSCFQYFRPFHIAPHISLLIFGTPMFLLCLANFVCFCVSHFCDSTQCIFLFSFVHHFHLLYCVLNTVMLMHFSFIFASRSRLLLFFCSFSVIQIVSCDVLTRLKRAFLYFYVRIFILNVYAHAT